MGDYAVIAADGSQSFGTFDRYKPARQLHVKLSKKRSVNLICMHGCGCVYRAIVKGGRYQTGVKWGPTHVGWRRSETCPKHTGSQPVSKKAMTDPFNLIARTSPGAGEESKP